MAEEVSIVIPNYNGRELMKRHLPSVIHALATYGCGGELIVVDDGSRDGSVGFLKHEVPGARLIVHKDNLGFQAACSTGIRSAEHDCVILLNSDVEVKPDFIKPLVKALSEEDVFAVGCLALNEDRETLGENVKIPYLSWGRLKFEKLRDMSLAECSDRITGAVPTLFATGGFMAMKKSLFFSMGGFDPLFEPFYYEDADLGWRAWKRGYKVLWEPESQVVHCHAGAILKHHGDRKARLVQERNRLLLIWKNLTSPHLFLFAHLLPLVLRILTKWLVFDLDFYRALFGASKKMARVLEARFKERREARLSDGKIFKEIRRAAPFS